MLRSFSPALVGTLVDGRYRVEAEIGRGGMGVVYRCANIRLHDRPCALKVLTAGVGTGGAAMDQQARFEREIQLVSRLTCPHTVQVFDSGTLPDHGPYIVMELLEGEPLDRLLLRGPVPVDRALDVIAGVLAALAEAHGKGIVHRDLKPANVFLVPTRGGVHPKVLDFGIAKTIDPEGVVDLTGSAAIGTPRFMAPEQFHGRPADARTDLYALGLLFYTLLVGRPPFSANDPLPPEMRAMPPQARLTWLHIHQPVARPAGLSDALNGVLVALLAKDPAWRPASADAVLRLLRAVPEAHGVPPAAASPSQPLLARRREDDTTGFPIAGEPSLVGRRDGAPRWPIAVAGGAVLAFGALVGTLWPRDVPLPPVPAICTDHLETTPSGALLLLDGREVGRTPYGVARACDARIEARVALAGYEPLTVSLSGAAEDLNISLASVAPDATAPSPPQDAAPPPPPRDVGSRGPNVGTGGDRSPRPPAAASSTAAPSPIGVW